MKILLWLLALAAFVAICLGIYCLIWQLWLFVVPQIWLTGPANLVRPKFWLFAGALWLITLLGRMIFSGGHKNG